MKTSFVRERFASFLLFFLVLTVTAFFLVRLFDDGTDLNNGLGIGKEQRRRIVKEAFSNQTGQQRQNFNVSLDEIATLIACDKAFFPWVGEPTPIPVHRKTNGGPLEAEQIDKWLLNCIKEHNNTNSSSTQTVANFLRDEILQTIAFLNTKLDENQQDLIRIERNLTNEIDKAPEKMTMKGQYEGRELARRRFDAIRMMKRAQRLAYLTTLANKLLLVQTKTKKKKKRALLSSPFFRQHIDELNKEQTNLHYLLQDIADNKTLSTGFLENYSKFQSDLEKIRVVARRVQLIASPSQNEQTHQKWSEQWRTQIEEPEKTGRVLYLVRHAERLDNIMSADSWLYGVVRSLYRLQSDNSPLSERGQREQADALGRLFEHIPVDHVFASPMERTMDTASRLLALKNGTIRIKVEPGLVERLDACEHPPSFWSIDQLAERFPLVDSNYTAPFFSRATIERIQREFVIPGNHEHPVQEIVDALLGRVLSTCQGKTFVFVAHGATIGAMHKTLTGKFGHFIAQASVSKFVELGGMGSGKFRMEYSSDTRHLGENRRNTRA